MKLVKLLALCCGLAMVFAFGSPKEAEAGYYGYPSYRYHYTYRYYYRPYYYKPRSYHYAIYYPRYPRYVYYYNPYRKVYWGRFDLQGEEGKQYSLLTEENRKGSLSEIKESDFPEPGPLPQIPGEEDTLGAPPTPPTDAPADANAPN